MTKFLKRSQEKIKSSTAHKIVISLNLIDVPIMDKGFVPRKE